jgi:hypothetical protein
MEENVRGKWALTGNEAIAGYMERSNQGQCT